jgi:hypothetical protein
LNGSLAVADGSFELRQLQKRFDKVNVKVVFTEKQMTIEQLMFNINGSHVQATGKVIGFIPLLIHPKEKAFASLAVYSPAVNLKSLIKKKTALSTASVSQKPFSRVLHEMKNKVAFDIQLTADKITNGPFQADQFSGKVRFYQDQLIADKVKMKLAGGTVLVNINMTNVSKSISQLKINTELKEGDIKRIFSSFNNFNQPAITAENLSGRLSSNVNLNVALDEQFKVQMASLDGRVEIKIKEGAISHFAPLENMSNFLFKKRDFTDVQFAEINTRFKLDGTTLGIERMEVQSSLLTLFVEGQYSLGDSTDLSIQIPLSNLKRRDKTYQPQNVGIDAKIGPSVFLRAHTKNGKTIISYDMFKKFRKKK